MAKKKGGLKGLLNVFKKPKSGCCSGYEIVEIKKDNQDTNDCCCKPNSKKN